MTRWPPDPGPRFALAPLFGAALTLAGCGATLTGAGLAAGAAQGRVDPASTQVEIRSPQQMGLSGRPRYVLRAQVAAVTDEHVEVETVLTSGTYLATTATSYFIDLTDDRAHRASEPDIVAESAPTNDPRCGTYQYSVRVVDREVQNSRGETIATVGHNERRTGVTCEGYWTRRQRLRFDRNALLRDGAQSLRLELRDLLVSFRVDWSGADAEGGAGNVVAPRGAAFQPGPPAYGAPPPRPYRRYR